MTEPYITTQDIMARLSVHENTVYSWCGRDENPMPHYRIPGGRYRYLWSEVEAWLDQERVGR